MYVEKLKKKGGMHDLWFLTGGEGVFILLAGYPLLFSHSFYILGNPSLYFTK